MKRSIRILRLFLLITCAIYSLGGTAQITSFQTSRNILKISARGLLQKHYELSFERKVDNGNASFQIMPSLYYRNGETDRTLGYQVELQYRKYFADWITHVPHITWYLGFYHVGVKWSSEHDYFVLDAGSQSYTTNTLLKTITASEGGGLLGTQISFSKRFVADLQVGLGVRFSTTNSGQVGAKEFLHRPSFEPGLAPSWSIQLGYLL